MFMEDFETAVYRGPILSSQLPFSGMHIIDLVLYYHQTIAREILGHL